MKRKIDGNTVLGAELSRSIMEATGRFEFIKEDTDLNTLTFWDEHWEEQFSIRNNLTLKELMEWIVNFYSKDYLSRGEQSVQWRIKKVLGLD